MRTIIREIARILKTPEAKATQAISVPLVPIDEYFRKTLQLGVIRFDHRAVSLIRPFRVDQDDLGKKFKKNSRDRQAILLKLVHSPAKSTGSTLH